MVLRGVLGAAHADGHLRVHPRQLAVQLQPRLPGAALGLARRDGRADVQPPVARRPVRDGGRLAVADTARAGGPVHTQEQDSAARVPRVPHHVPHEEERVSAVPRVRGVPRADRRVQARRQVQAPDQGKQDPVPRAGPERL